MPRLKLSLPDELGDERGPKRRRRAESGQPAVRTRLGSPEARQAEPTPTIVRWMDNWARSDDR